MATAANKVTVKLSDSSTLGLAWKTSLKVVAAQATANDITQLSTNKVLLIFDVDSTDAHDRALLVSQAEAAVHEMKRQLFLKDKPSNISTSTVTTYRPRGQAQI